MDYDIDERRCAGAVEFFRKSKNYMFLFDVKTEETNSNRIERNMIRVMEIYRQSVKFLEQCPVTAFYKELIGPFQKGEDGKQIGDHCEAIAKLMEFMIRNGISMTDVLQVSFKFLSQVATYKEEDVNNCQWDVVLTMIVCSSLETSFSEWFVDFVKDQ